MKKHLRVLSLILVVSMLTCVMFSCAAENVQESETLPAMSRDTDENRDYVDDLPELNFEGADVSIICSTREQVKDEFFSESLSTNALSSAVYTRNQMVNARLNVNLNVITDSGSDHNSINEKVSMAIKSGEDAYDIVSAPTYKASHYVIEGCYRNLYNLEYLNLDKLYWSQGFNDVFSFWNDKQYLATGTAVISIYRFMYATIYNKDMFYSVGEDDLFDVVNSGDWTIEYQTRISRSFFADTGNPETTTYGMATGYSISVDPYWVSLQVPILQKNANNSFETTVFNDSAMAKLTNAVDLVLKLYAEPSVKVWDESQDRFSISDFKPITTFYSQQAAMTTTTMYAIENNMDQLALLNYGIVPMPKYDIDQEKYYSALQDQVSALGISGSVTDNRLPMMGAVLECMASESQNTIVETYYGKLLSYRYLQDYNSQQMLKLIYEGSGINMASAYSGLILSTGYITTMRKLIESQMNTTVSTVAGFSNELYRNIEELNDNFSKVK